MREVREGEEIRERDRVGAVLYERIQLDGDERWSHKAHCKIAESRLSLHVCRSFALSMWLPLHVLHTLFFPRSYHALRSLSFWT